MTVLSTVSNPHALGAEGIDFAAIPMEKIQTVARELFEKSEKDMVNNREAKK